jgi:hypothetical protein
MLSQSSQIGEIRMLLIATVKPRSRRPMSNLLFADALDGKF